MNKKRHKILIVFGTRPEAIKMLPVIIELKKSKNWKVKICVTAQHREMLDQILQMFEITPDFDLNLMEKSQTLTHLTAKIFTELQEVFDLFGPDWVIVQGDTTTTMVASIVAFYNGSKVAHIEAGLRTYDKYAPFPEEINRRITSTVTDLHFAPTTGARDALIKEGISKKNIYVTGNTIVDTLLMVKNSLAKGQTEIPNFWSKMINGKRLILVTSHRRENFGRVLHQICLALSDLARIHREVIIIYSVHLNPHVYDIVNKMLKGKDRIFLTKPLPYDVFIWLMSRADILLTDSGGIQEEAPTFNIPVFILRRVTERREGLRSGHSYLINTNRAGIVRSVTRYLKENSCNKWRRKVRNPYGDGLAA
ncbi:MAG: UDP-N-acetylglucosamine 2-epimerase, partial [Ignavibacteria bacterium RBG_13_36_8]